MAAHLWLCSFMALWASHCTAGISFTALDLELVVHLLCPFRLEQATGGAAIVARQGRPERGEPCLPAFCFPDSCAVSLVTRKQSASLPADQSYTPSRATPSNTFERSSLAVL